MALTKYGLTWPESYDALRIELYVISKGGFFLKDGKRFGVNLNYHHKQAQTLLWPDDDWHRWADLILKTFSENDISVLIGCSDSSKTWSMSKFILTDYWAAPDRTLWLVSTTEGRGSELRIWGCI